jgi:hypothetical protein
MAELTPSQQRTREQVERLIGLMAPALDAILAAGDRISRIVAPEDFEYYPERPLEKRRPAGQLAGRSPDDDPS